jgi:hypothetical protein
MEDRSAAPGHDRGGPELNRYWQSLVAAAMLASCSPDAESPDSPEPQPQVPHPEVGSEAIRARQIRLESLPDWLIGSWQIERAEDFRPREGCPCRLDEASPPSDGSGTASLELRCTRDQPRRYFFTESAIQSDVWQEDVRRVFQYPERADVVELEAVAAGREPARLDYQIRQDGESIVIRANIAGTSGICFEATANAGEAGPAEEPVWRLPRAIP